MARSAIPHIVELVHDDWSDAAYPETAVLLLAIVTSTVSEGCDSPLSIGLISFPAVASSCRAVPKIIYEVLSANRAAGGSCHHNFSEGLRLPAFH